MIQIVYNIRKYKYLVGSGIIFLFLIIVLYSPNIKENIYIFYDEDIANCSNGEYINLVDYIICDKEKKIYFEKRKGKVKSVLSFEKQKLLTLEKLFANYYGYNFILKCKKKNFFLVLKKGDIFRIVPVNIIQFIS